MSSATVKTDNGSKVLPGDKTGLPWEVWRIVLSFLSADDLCRSAMVCKTWNELVQSLDNTKWRELYLKCTDWRHPCWPLNLHAEPQSWRQAYKDQYLASNFWTQNIREPDMVTCLSVFKRTKNRKTITVGQGKEHATLKSALGVANDYDRIVVYPGIYDEQFEMSSKIPFELIGCGELGSVILVVCIEQIAVTGRLNNLVFRAPWFTNFILKVRCGYLQVDNCIMEDGMVYVQNPGTVNLNFCTFRHATVILQHVNASIIQNCEFSQTDSAAVTVEGFPKEEKNWTYGAIVHRIMSHCQLQRRLERQKSGETATKSAISTAISLSSATTNQKSAHRSAVGGTSCGTGAMSADARRRSHDTDKNLFDTLRAEGAGDDVSIPNSRLSLNSLDDLENGHDHSGKKNKEGPSRLPCKLQGGEAGGSGGGGMACGGTDVPVTVLASTSSASVTRMVTSTDIAPEIYTADTGDGAVASGSLTAEPVRKKSQTADTDDTNLNSETLSRIESYVSDCAKYSVSSGGSGGVHSDHGKHGNDAHSLESKSQRSLNRDNAEDEHELDLRLPQLANLHDDERGEGDSSSSEGSMRSASGSDVFDEEEPGFHSGSTSTSSDDDGLPMTDSDGEFSSSEESVIMLTYPERHQPRSVSAQKEHAEVASISSQNQSEHIDIIQDHGMKKMLNDIRGCFIFRCRLTQSKGGVMVSLQGHAIIQESEINSVGYGIRCIQNSRVVVLKNEIHHCRTSGVFMRLAASGLLTGNDIHSNCEAGIDIRKNADPIVQCNRIHHGKRSGVVVLGSGRGQIKHNDIYQNKEAGVYILYRGNPTVCHNQIYSGRAAGIAVNEGGRGHIHDNVITGNQWGGIDIRHGGDPVISRNIVCSGLSDGIVIGEGGRGSIENNVITGNAGCGVWIMAAHQPLIHGNEIHSNRDSGISLVNRMDSSHDNEAMVVDRQDIQSSRSLDFWNFTSDDSTQPKHRTVSMATVEYNKVYHNNGKGIAAVFGEDVVIQCNAVHANKSDGIHVDQACPVVVKDNSVTCNAGHGVHVTSQGKVHVSGNGIYDNRDHGMLCQNEAQICNNDIVGNNWSGIQLTKNPVAMVRENRIQVTNDHAVCLVEVQDCTVEDNVFYTSVVSKTINADKASKCNIQNNQVLPHPPVRQVEGKQRDAITSLDLTRWILTDPKPRPHVELPSPLPSAPVHHVTSITKVTVPADNTCEQGSKFCVIV